MKHTGLYSPDFEDAVCNDMALDHSNLATHSKIYLAYLGQGDRTKVQTINVVKSVDD